MSLTKATYSMVNGAPANVLDFGADPTGLADSTAAFTNALAVAERVYAPKGTYLVGDVYVAGTKVLYGDGMESTFLKANKNCTYGVLYAGQPFTTIEQLCIDGNASSYTANGFLTDGTLYSFANFSQILNRVMIKNCDGKGVYVKGANVFSLLNSRVTDCSDTLVYLDSAHKYLIDNCDIEISNSIGIESVIVTPHGGAAPTSGTISNTWFEALTATNCISLSAYNQFVYGNHFNSLPTTGALILVKAGADNCVISENNFQNYTVNGIEIEATAVNTKVSFNRGVGFTGGYTTFGVLNNGTSTCIENGEQNVNAYVLQSNNMALLGNDVVIRGSNGGYSYLGGRLVLGTNYLWVDPSGVLRIKTSAPTSPTDGTVVGTQT